MWKPGVSSNIQITVNINNITLHGDGAILFGDLSLHETAEVTITGFEIHAGSVAGINLDHSSGTVINGNNIVESQVGIRVFESNNNEIKNNNISEVVLWCMVIRGDSSENVIKNNVLAGGQSGVDIELGFGNTIKNNDISNCYVGISLAGSADTVVKGNRISYSTSEGIRLTGITIFPPPYFQPSPVLPMNNMIKGNEVLDSGVWDLFWDGGGENNIYKDNIFGTSNI